MPGKKAGLKTERKKTVKSQRAKKAAPKQTEKLEKQPQMAKVHPFAKFIHRRHDAYNKDTSNSWYQEPSRKKAV